MPSEGEDDPPPPAEDQEEGDCLDIDNLDLGVAFDLFLVIWEQDAELRNLAAHHDRQYNAIRDRLRQGLQGVQRHSQLDDDAMEDLMVRGLQRGLIPVPNENPDGKVHTERKRNSRRKGLKYNKSGGKKTGKGDKSQAAEEGGEDYVSRESKRQKKDGDEDDACGPGGNGSVVAT